MRSSIFHPHFFYQKNFNIIFFCGLEWSLIDILLPDLFVEVSNSDAKDIWDIQIVCLFWSPLDIHNKRTPLPLNNPPSGIDVAFRILLMEILGLVPYSSGGEIIEMYEKEEEFCDKGVGNSIEYNPRFNCWNPICWIVKISEICSFSHESICIFLANHRSTINLELRLRLIPIQSTSQCMAICPSHADI